MRYLQNAPFSVQMGDQNAQKNYRDNWERTFGKLKPKPPKKPEVKVDEAIANR